MEPLLALLYVSDAGVEPGSGEELDILRAAVPRNAEDGITGFLHRSDEHFLEYAEGDARALMRLLTRLCQDERHRRIRVLDVGPIDARRFPAWSMGLTPGERTSLHAFIGCQPGEDPFEQPPARILSFLEMQAQELTVTAV